MDKQQFEDGSPIENSVILQLSSFVSFLEKKIERRTRVTSKVSKVKSAISSTPQKKREKLPYLGDDVNVAYIIIIIIYSSYCDFTIYDHFFRAGIFKWCNSRFANKKPVQNCVTWDLILLAPNFLDFNKGRLLVREKKKTPWQLQLWNFAMLMLFLTYPPWN